MGIIILYYLKLLDIYIKYDHVFYWNEFIQNKYVINTNTFLVFIDRIILLRESTKRKESIYG